jgi:hypothetical protein
MMPVVGYLYAFCCGSVCYAIYDACKGDYTRVRDRDTPTTPTSPIVKRSERLRSKPQPSRRLLDPDWIIG